jgi:hypothetical protein
METPSRLDNARRQVRIARYSIGAVAVAGFALFAMAARAAHPGKSSTAAAVSSSASTSASDDQTAESFGFGTGSISPSVGSTPSVQSGGS